MDRLLPSRRRAAEAIHRAIISIRQAAEWGVGSVDKVFHWLHMPLLYDPSLWRTWLNNIFRLANFRVRRVGISQIMRTFGGEMVREVWGEDVRVSE